MPTGVYEHKSPSAETRARMSLAHKGMNAWLIGKKGDKCNAWKGDKVGYQGIHKWIGAELGKPNKCENCLTTVAPRFEWANLSGKYLRDFSDWARLCTQCHRLIDNNAVTGIRAHEKKMIGRKYGLLTVLANKGGGMWLFRCDCGKQKLIRKAHVNAGKTKSCGCFQRH